MSTIMKRLTAATVAAAMATGLVATAAVPAAQADPGRHWNKKPRTVVIHRTERRVVKHVHVYRPAPPPPPYRPYRVRQTYAYPTANGQLLGGLLGAALGGLAGSQIGKGDGRTAAIIGGVVLGGLVGGSIGDTMDRVDQAQTSRVLETSPTGTAVSWVNPDTGANYTVTPTQTYRLNGQDCRDFTTWGVIDGYEEQLHGTACRTDDGRWASIN